MSNKHVNKKLAFVLFKSNLNQNNFIKKLIQINIFFTFEFFLCTRHNIENIKMSDPNIIKDYFKIANNQIDVVFFLSDKIS